MSKKTKEKQEISPDDVGAMHLNDEQLNPNPVDGEELPIVKKKELHFRTVISGAEFKEFVEGEIYVGVYGEPVIRKKDGLDVANNPNEKAGTTMGYTFQDDNGVDVIIGASQQVTEVMQQCKKGDYVRFTFLGKGVNSKNQPFNRFKIEVAE